MKIKFFTTGGTIDKVYFDAKSEFEVGEPQVREVVENSNVAFEYEVESILDHKANDVYMFVCVEVEGSHIMII